nr:hypothetical protein [Candidatus Sigynarchaeum springense]
MRATQDGVKVVLIIGSVLAAVGATLRIIDLAEAHHTDAQNYIGPVVVIGITVLIFIMVGLLHVRKIQIQLTSWILIVFVVIEIFLSGASLAELMGLGIIVEIVGTTILAMLEG